MISNIYNFFINNWVNMGMIFVGCVAIIEYKMQKKR